MPTEPNNATNTAPVSNPTANNAQEGTQAIAKYNL